MNTESKKQPPAYVSYATFETFVKQLKGTAVPPVIDRSVLGKMSGATQSQLLSALRFLKLIDNQDRTTEVLNDLVDAYTEDGDRTEWKGALKTVILSAYARIIDDLSIESATARQLQKQFKDAGGVDGAMAERSIRFFIKALKEAGIPHSPHFKPPTTPRNTNNSRPSNSKGNSKSASEPDQSSNEKTKTYDAFDDDLFELPLPFKNRRHGKIIVPRELSPSDLELIGHAIKMIEAYTVQQPGDGGKQDE